MAKKIVSTTLNATTLDILNVIRANASYDYQSQVPVVTKETDIPAVGEIIYGTPAIANQFLNALINRIAAVRVQSATFNNPYRLLKGGYLEFGETVEDIFVAISQVVEYTPEKGEEREFKRSLPDVKSVFHVMNWRVMYPVTIQDDDLKRAFLSIDGVTDLIAKIVDQVYTAAEYDEFLLFKYLIIKAVAHGKMKPVALGADLKSAAVAMRSVSNKLPFMSSTYNEAGVKNNTPKDRQIIFMDAEYNADFDVNVLASAFNMDKADFMGRLFLIDSFEEFDNERFSIIRENSDRLEEVTSEELALMADVKAVLMDEKWFQVYDNQNKFTEKYVASCLYWNYFYHVWKTVSYSPFANAVSFVNTSVAPIVTTSAIKFKVDSVDVDAKGNITITFAQTGVNTLASTMFKFEQTEAFTEGGIGVQPYGALICGLTSAGKADEYYIVIINTSTGTRYKSTTKITPEDAEVGDVFSFTTV